MKRIANYRPYGVDNLQSIAEFWVEIPTAEGTRFLL